MHISFTGAGRDALDAALHRASETAPHWRPLLKAVRDEGCGLLMVAQSPEAFEVPEDRPHIVVLGDDLAAALGPGGFDDESVRAFLPRCGAVAIVACAPIAALYWEVATWAVKDREPVLIIETRPEREAEWVELVRALVPSKAGIAVATVRPQGNA